MSWVCSCAFGRGSPRSKRKALPSPAARTGHPQKLLSKYDWATLHDHLRGWKWRGGRVENVFGLRRRVSWKRQSPDWRLLVQLRVDNLRWRFFSMVKATTPIGRLAFPGTGPPSNFRGWGTHSIDRSTRCGSFCWRGCVSDGKNCRVLLRTTESGLPGSFVPGNFVGVRNGERD
jgi:hypothetical protein